MNGKLKVLMAVGYLLFVLAMGGSAWAALDVRIGTGQGVNEEAPLLLKNSSLQTQLDIVAGEGKYNVSGAESPTQVIARLVRYSLGFIGVGFLAVLFYGGFLWTTSAGTEEKINQAKKWLANGAIGALIILASLSIWIFVVERIYIATTQSVEEGAAADWMSKCAPGDTECQQRYGHPQEYRP